MLAPIAGVTANHAMRDINRRRSNGAGRQPTCEHADHRYPEDPRSDGSASTCGRELATAAASCCVIRDARISVHDTAVTDRRSTHPIVDAMAEEYASGARLSTLRVPALPRYRVSLRYLIRCG